MAGAQPNELILGLGGQLQQVLTGTHGEVFGGDGDAPVLAVETVAPEGDITRVLVPGTEDARFEVAPRLFQDPKTDTFVLLWRSQIDDADARLDFATFDGAEWSQVLTLEQDGIPVSPAGDLKIIETHDAFELELEDGDSISAERMIIHLLWQGPGTHYVPLTFVEGQYLGSHSLFTLNELFLQAPEAEGGEDDSDPVELTAGLAQALEMRVSGDDASVLVTFANPSSHRIGSLEISPLPLDIGLLGEQVREHLFTLADLYDPDDLEPFTGGMRAGIVIIGQRFHLHDAHSAFIANQVADWIQSSGESYGWEGFESLGDDARDLAIDVTREVTVSASADSADPDSEIIRLDVSGLFESSESDPMYVFDVRTRANLPAPEIGEQPVALFTSHRGDNLLIAWLGEGGGQAHWVESREDHDGGSWSDIFSLALGEQVTVETARRLLTKRIR